LRPRDLTLADLAAQFVKGLSSVDGKLLRSSRALLVAPGTLTAAYVRGERRRFLAPLALFLVANALFVGIQSVTGTNILSSSLYSHLHTQDWKDVAQSLVMPRLAANEETLANYAPRFDQAVIFNAKALMILMVLAFAPIAWLLFHGRRYVAGAHVVFALHLYAFILALLCLSIVMAGLWSMTGGGGLETPLVDTSLTIFNLTACAAYIYLAIGSAYGATGAKRYLSAALLTGVVGVLFVGYRFVIFLITLYSTT
jgi:hypothetical protein